VVDEVGDHDWQSMLVRVLGNEIGNENAGIPVVGAALLRQLETACCEGTTNSQRMSSSKGSGDISNETGPKDVSIEADWNIGGD
jgi:hypothetical protein